MNKKGSISRVQWYNVTIKPNDNPMIDENPEVEAVEVEVEEVEAVEEEEMEDYVLSSVEEVSQEKEAEETV